MTKKWVLIAVALFVAACGGQDRYNTSEEPIGSSVACPPKMDCEIDHRALYVNDLIRVEHSAPEEGCVNKPVLIEIKLTALHNVSDIVVRDTFSQHATVIDSTPHADMVNDTLEWHIDSMECGETISLQANLQTEEVGCLVDCITVSALPRLCVSTYIGDCHLFLEKMGPECLCLGDSGYYTIIVRNDGTSSANNVVVSDLVPEGLRHASGDSEITWEIGDLAPGYSQTMSLCLEAETSGRHCNVALASASNFEEIRTEMCTEVSQSGIEIKVTGTMEQFIGKRADYTITVTNTGDIDLCDVIVTDEIAACTTVCNLDGGILDGSMISWELANLPAGESKSWNISLENCTPTDCDNSISVSGCSTLCGTVEDSADCQTVWKGHAGLLIEMIDTCDPMLVDEEGEYKIKIRNQGTAADHNIQVIAFFPEQIEPKMTSGTTHGEISGNTVTFDLYKELAPGECIDYSIETLATAPGDARIKVELHSQMLQHPVTEEESTYVY